VTDHSSGDLFGRHDPSVIQIVAWVAIGLILNIAGEPFVVPYVGASMAIISTYLFIRNDYALGRTLAWTIPTAMLFVSAVIGEGWIWSLLTYAAVVLHGAFYLLRPVRTVWYRSPV
jgi:hypothetical protein